MKQTYAHLFIPARIGDLREDAARFLMDNGHPKTAEHCQLVGDEAGKIAALFGIDTRSAANAGYLHDISGVFPNDQRIRVARELGIEVLPEEETFPMIVHQKISKAMARDIFGIEEEPILDAVGCHTTLRAKATPLDKVLFVADKIVWDQSGQPPYLDRLLKALDVSLDDAAFAYISYLWEGRDSLKVVHPWLAEAYLELKERL